MSEIDRFRFSYDYDFPGGSYWLIEKRFLWVFWKKYYKYPYKILKDGSPNTTEVMDYIEKLNQNKDDRRK